VPKNKWLPALQNAQVIMVGGGGEGYLLKKMQESGFTEEIKTLLEDRVYVGISAGAMATGQLIDPQASEDLYKEPQISDEVAIGLKLVDFEVLPHFNDEYFSNVNEDNIKKVLKQYKITRPVYALSDGTAIQVINNEIKKVGKKSWRGCY